MPTVVRSGGFAVRILFPPREHASPHVHVVKGGGEVIIRLAKMGRPVRIIEVHGMKSSDVVKAVRLVEIWKERTVGELGGDTWRINRSRTIKSFHRSRRPESVADDSVRPSPGH